VDDRTSGLVIRALRRRRGWSQKELAARTDVSQSTVSRAERGWLEELTLRVIRAIFAALEARVQLTPRWKGAELERLLDEAHAVVVAEVARRLVALGWIVELEVTYSEWGERGSIDVLGLRVADGAIVVVEVKTDVASTEALARKLDEKARLAPGIVSRRWRWEPTVVGRLLVMPDETRLRRLVRHHEVIARMFPVDAVAIRRWLSHPDGAMTGLWFLSDTRPLTQRRAQADRRPRIAGRASVRVPAEPVVRAGKRPDRRH
jgi:HTH-type transcriptional regulator/antitoxin HipB